MTEAYIGIDLGSSGVRAVAVDVSGSVVAGHSRPLTIHRGPGGIAEHQMGEWESEAGACLRDLAAELEERSYVPAAVAATGQMNGPVLLDRSLRPAAPIHMWCDARCADQCEQIAARIPTEELLERTGHTAVTGYTAPKLMWFAEHEPDVLRRATHLMFPKDFLTFKLTGRIGSDLSDASNSLLLNVRSGAWDDSVVSELGLDAIGLPDVIGSTEVAGTISREGAAWSGLPEGTPAAAGAGDSIAAAYGAGQKDASKLQIVVGSAGNVNGVLDQPLVDPKGRVHTGFFVDGEHWICSGVLQAAGASIQWWADVLGRSVPEMIAEVDPARPCGVFFAPYLAGERTPHLDARVRGGFVSLEGATGRAEMTRAVLEGVAFAFRDAAEVFVSMGVEASDVAITGGGARSDAFCRIMANALGKPLRRIEADVTVMGAAMLAACVSGRFTAWQDVIDAWPVLGELFTPDDGDRYHEAWCRFRQLYPSLAGWAREPLA